MKFNVTKQHEEEQILQIAQFEFAIKFFLNFWNRENLIFSTFLQIKIEHEFFKFYLCRLFVDKLNKCNENCNEI